MVVDRARKNSWASSSAQKNALEFYNASNELSLKLGRSPSNQELADHMHLSLEQLDNMRLMAASTNVLSLDLLPGKGGIKGPVILQEEAVGREQQPEAEYLEKELRKRLIEGIESLNDREKTVLSLFYVEELSKKEIARIMGVTPPRISQIYADAINELRRYLSNYLAPQKKAASHKTAKKERKN